MVSNLKSLNFKNNKITNLDNIDYISKSNLCNLKRLNLINNPIQNCNEYIKETKEKLNEFILLDQDFNEEDYEIEPEVVNKLETKLENSVDNLEKLERTSDTTSEPLIEEPVEKVSTPLLKSDLNLSSNKLSKVKDVTNSPNSPNSSNNLLTNVVVNINTPKKIKPARPKSTNKNNIAIFNTFNKEIKEIKENNINDIKVNDKFIKINNKFSIDNISDKLNIQDDDIFDILNNEYHEPNFNVAKKSVNLSTSINSLNSLNAIKSPIKLKSSFANKEAVVPSFINEEDISPIMQKELSKMINCSKQNFFDSKYKRIIKKNEQVIIRSAASPVKLIGRKYSISIKNEQNEDSSILPKLNK